MLLKSLVVQLLPSIVTGIIQRFEGELLRIDDGVILDKRNLWFEYHISSTLSPCTEGDQFLVSVLMEAMREQRDIHIKGCVSATLLRNLQEYQLYWAMMRPSEYVAVGIFTESVTDKIKLNNQAVCAFSGGLDSAFSVWRHSHQSSNSSRYDIAMAVMIHGFDIPLKSIEAFDRLFDRWAIILKTLELPLFSVRTNFREVMNIPWEDAYGAALVATMIRFKTMIGNALIGSSAPYDALIQPYGSSPITDNLFSSSDFTVVHDGASFKRLDKARMISRWAGAMDHLQVCWEGPDRDRNCCKCEKCIRTKAHFAIQKLPVPTTLGDPGNIFREIASVRIKTVGSMSGWKQMRLYAAENQLLRWYISIWFMMVRNRSRQFFDRFVVFLKTLRRKFRTFIKGLLRSLVVEQ